LELEQRFKPIHMQMHQPCSSESLECICLAVRQPCYCFI
jgi:hypothetical protein